ncbi:DUF421 domain-containing protein [Falsigemmobacter faecalis]|uniref:DUF421 domain-containing protein n=1 Tax=Falsigemmobacter faecalis TaxID=2488730 RepID=A0A3P3DG32_9RHOB|nr:YetF domain-containing protein [Falsigemmobacter faecalis]RRH73203.1 DUF421 domain-containing protein [Falsigemmobacter faecalis]
MDPVLPFDLQRLFAGQHPPLFYAEILFRIAVIWIWSIALLRWIGGRSISQLSLVEFLLVIALGSAVGDAMFYAEVPLFHAMLVILMLVLLDKLIDLVIRRWRGAKALIDGEPRRLLTDGVMICDGITARQIGTAELAEMLRLRGVQNLGSLSGVWMEPSGEISLFPADRPVMGLAIVPPLEEQPSEAPGPGDTLCCRNCGSTTMTRDTEGPVCSNCRSRDLTAARAAPEWRR